MSSKLALAINKPNFIFCHFSLDNLKYFFLFISIFLNNYDRKNYPVLPLKIVFDTLRSIFLSSTQLLFFSFVFKIQTQKAKLQEKSITELFSYLTLLSLGKTIDWPKPTSDFVHRLWKLGDIQSFGIKFPLTTFQ